ncbi:MAG: DUF3014 domain-containing protein [Candidatus Aminicenantaceae bacterium]
MDEKNKVIVAGASIIIVIAIIATVYLVFFKDGKPAETETLETLPASVEPNETGTPDPEATEPSEVFDVSLDESDDLIRDLVGQLSVRPELARWLLTDDLIQKFVAAVDNIANGESPRSHMTFLQVPDKFSVLEKDGELLMDPAGYDRYDTVADVFSSLPTRESVDLFRQLTPVLQEAYSKLGYPGVDFHTTLMQAIEELLAVPGVNEDVVLEEKLQSYGMADPRLEGMSQAQKHLFRMGPRNVGRIKAKLREFKGLLAQT